MKSPVARVLSVLLFVTTFSLLPALSSAQVSATQAQDAEVTFYSSASALKLALPYTKHGAFVGSIFDGKTKIATITYRRFVTVRFGAGAHIFSASYSGRHPAKNSQLPLDLMAGQSYFIRTDSEFKNAVVVGFHKGQLEEVSCQTAHAEAGDTKPLKEKYVAPGARPRRVAATSMPACK